MDRDDSDDPGDVKGPLLTMFEEGEESLI